MFALCGAGLIIATWLYLVIVRPVDWESVGASTPALITLVGYVGGALLLIASALPSISSRALVLIPIALALNIVIGEIIGKSGIPLYLDSVGTVLVAVLAGPAAGMATGALSSVVWGLLNPAALPFAAGSAFIGWAAGWIKDRGWMSALWQAVVSGAVVGLVAGAIAAPVAAFVYGGTAGVGTGFLVSAFREIGASLLQSVTLQSFVSDPLDKALVFALVYLCVSRLPRSVVTPRKTNDSRA
ncbi:ECF transporter S component [Corynebacterium tapiri]|uniref:ECF transporter S component n=1 Tax=Corynebacterium tapiri TaxID=1448266 RepID=A0A5C4U6G5_9CORY|nr:ECF transporter S component [Corynebacterium tapiri]TNL99863.1 ECF transporter S component [Corynebacterium tapiri]